MAATDVAHADVAPTDMQRRWLRRFKSHNANEVLETSV